MGWSVKIYKAGARGVSKVDEHRSTVKYRHSQVPIAFDSNRHIFVLEEILILANVSYSVLWKYF